MNHTAQLATLRQMIQTLKTQQNAGYTNVWGATRGADKDVQFVLYAFSAAKGVHPITYRTQVMWLLGIFTVGQDQYGRAMTIEEAIGLLQSEMEYLKRSGYLTRKKLREQGVIKESLTTKKEVKNENKF